MLILEYKLRLSRAQQAAMDEAIRTTQFIRNKCVRLWMDGRGVSANDLQTLCARLAHEYSFAAQLASSPSRRLPRLGRHRALLHQLSGETSREEGIPPLPARLPLGRVQADRMAARPGRQAPYSL